MISYIVGADERTEKVRRANSKQKLTPKHERIIRRAPKQYQDDIAKVVLTRGNSNRAASSLIEKVPFLLLDSEN